WGEKMPREAGTETLDRRQRLGASQQEDEMRDWGMTTRRRAVLRAGAMLLGVAMLTGGPAAVSAAGKIKVAGVYTQPIQQKWDARLHQALDKAAKAGEIEYVFSEKVANTDYARVLREYAEGG